MEISGALWVLIGLVSVVALISFIVSMRTKGIEKYGLSFFKSWQFLLLSFGAVFLYTVGASEMQDAAQVAGGTCFVTSIIALWLNIKRSNLIFGLFYTLAQAITAYLIFLVVLVAVMKFINRNERS